jgi:hypothetical protein
MTSDWIKLKRILVSERLYFRLLRSVQTSSGAHTASYSTGTMFLHQRKTGRGVVLTTDLHLAPRLEMSGVIPLLRLHAVIDTVLATMTNVSNRSCTKIFNTLYSIKFFNKAYDFSKWLNKYDFMLSQGNNRAHAPQFLSYVCMFADIFILISLVISFQTKYCAIKYLSEQWS